MNLLKKIGIWVSRIPNRKGYGVQSPSAFSFVTSVIYEKTAYYTYQDLKEKRKGQKALDEKMDRLLFRLSNFVQPETIVQVGDSYPLSAEYMQAGCKKASCQILKIQENPQEALKAALNGKPLHIFHLTAVNDAWFQAALEFTAEKSLFVVEGIYEGKEQKAWWKRIQEDPRVGITYDLYDAGLLFFELSKYKQHYKINFV